MTQLSQKALTFFEDRGISAENAVRMGIYSARRVTTGGESRVERNDSGEIIAFPFFEHGEVVAEKYRGPGKRFSQRPKPRQTFYNSDVLNDPALYYGGTALVITEGEMDCLSVIEAGHPFVVSVSDGAPPARDAEGNLIEVPENATDIDPERDDKFKFIANNWDRLKSIKRIIIAADADEPGRRLAAELVRRLGRVRCYFVAYPPGCKDFNDVLVHLGTAAVIMVIGAAKPYPVSGVYLFSDLPEEPEFAALTTGWGRLDEFLKVYSPALMVVTGLASHGKSTWTTQLVAQLAAKHSWVIAVASFEMRLKPFVTDKLATVFLDEQPRASWSFADHCAAAEWLDQHFCFIAPEPDCGALHDIGWLLEKAEAAIIRHGAKVLLIDPWNEVEHARRRDETLTDYTNRALRELKDFGRRFDVLIIVVAHPAKSAVNKAPEELTLYDVSDSAAFQNKADLGVVIARLGDLAMDRLTGVFVRKVRYQPQVGNIGAIELTFDPGCGLFGQ
jgi:twinkle protein